MSPRRLPDYTGSLQTLRVRTRVQTAPTNKIQERNQQADFSGARAFEPAEKATERIRQQQNANQDRLDSWIEHPDERVPIALAETYKNADSDKNWWRGESGEQAAARLVRRAIEEAEQDRVSWTPLLDAVRKNSLPPWGFVSSRYAFRHFPDRDGFVEPIDKAFEEQRLGRAEMQELLTFQARAVRKHIITQLSLGSFEVEKLLETPNQAKAACQKATFTPEGQQRMAQRLLEELEEALRQFPRNLSGENRADEEIGKRQSCWYNQADWAQKGLTRLLAYQDYQPDDQDFRPIVEACFNWAEQPGVENGRFLDQQPEEMVVKLVAENGLGQHLSGEILDRLHEKLCTTIQGAQIAGVEGSLPRTWQRALQQGQSTSYNWMRRRTCQSFLEQKEALQQDEIWMFVFNSPEAGTLGALARAVEDPNRREQTKQRMLTILQEGVEAKGYLTARRKVVRHFLDGVAENEQDLWRLYLGAKTLENPRQHIKKIVDHPKATLALAARILEDTRSINLRRYLIGLEWVRRSREVREAVADTRDLELLKQLIEEADSDEIGRFFRRLARKDKTLAGQKLDDLSRKQLQKLEKGDLTPLLQAQDSEVRLKAIRQTAQAGEPPEQDQEDRGRSR